MKVLFLDFDGVLNHHRWFSDFLAREGREPLFGGDDDVDHFDPACVERVNRICRETGAVICISSAWRLLFFLGGNVSMWMAR